VPRRSCTHRCSSFPDMRAPELRAARVSPQRDECTAPMTALSNSLPRRAGGHSSQRSATTAVDLTNTRCPSDATTMATVAVRAWLSMALTLPDTSTAAPARSDTTTGRVNVTP